MKRNNPIIPNIPGANKYGVPGVDLGQKKTFKRIRRANKSIKDDNNSSIATSSVCSNESNYSYKSNPIINTSMNPLDSLSVILLQWKLIADINKTGHEKNTSSSSSSSSIIEENKSTKKKPSFKTFKSLSTYVDNIGSLLMEEIKGNVLSNMGNNTKNPSCSGDILTSVYRNGNAADPRFPLVRLTCISRTTSTMGSEEASGIKPKGPIYMDLLLITENAIKLPLKINNCKNYKQPSVLALVTSTADRTLTITVERIAWHEFTILLEQHILNNKGAGSGIKPGKTRLLQHPVTFTILGNITSYWREYLALHSLRSIPLRLQILEGPLPIDSINGIEPERVSPPMPTSPGLLGVNSNSNNDESHNLNNTVESMMMLQKKNWRLHGFSPKFEDYCRRCFNTSQLDALQTALRKKSSSNLDLSSLPLSSSSSTSASTTSISSFSSNNSMDTGFTLIQGPPGTGKTTTVLGILNALHVREFNYYYESALTTVLGEEGLRCRSAQDTGRWLRMLAVISKQKPRILVVAPSNVAVDNIIEPIITKGFMDGSCNQYFPNILRLGEGRGSRVRCVSLEETVGAVGALTETECANKARMLYTEMERALVRVIHLQGLLISLKNAFHMCPVLPPGWELRVQGNMQPYWVDHNTCTTSNQPPQPSPSDKVSSVPLEYIQVDASSSGFIDNDELYEDASRLFCQMFPRTLRDLPEFGIHAKNLTSEIESIANYALQVARLQSRLHGMDVTTDTFKKGFKIMGGGAAFGRTRAGVNSRQVVEGSVIDEAHIVFTTLNGSGHPSLEGSVFPTAVIDEAAQCTETSALIPLRLGVKRCIMVGDPKQLSATLFSDTARHSGFDRSLMERFIEIGLMKPVMLNTQYRMHPLIAAFASKTFYNNRLLNGPNVNQSNFLPTHLQEHTNINTDNSIIKFNLFKPLQFYNLLSSEEVHGSTSRSNPSEAVLCVKLVQELRKEAQRVGFKVGSVGIITPYQQQLGELRHRFAEADLTQILSRSNGNHDEMERDQKLDVELNTVDAFQGREKDVIIISCVRSAETGGIGFLRDTRRLNVALTRAKHALFVVGKASALKQNEHWNALLEHMKSNQAIINVPDASVDIAALIKSEKQKMKESVDNNHNEEDMYSKVISRKHEREVITAEVEEGECK